MEVFAVGASKGLVDIADERGPGGLRDVEMGFVVKGTLVKIPIIWEGAG